MTDEYRHVPGADFDAAARCDTPPRTLAVLAARHGQQLAPVLAVNPNTPASALARIAANCPLQVVKHPNTSAATLHDLALMKRHYARDRTGTPLSSMLDNARVLILLTAIARHPHTGPDTLLQFVTYLTSDTRIMAAIARHPQTPAPLLRAWWNNQDTWNGIAIGAVNACDLAANPSLPHDLVHRCVSSIDADVLIAVAQNPAVSEQAIRWLSSSEDIGVRAAALRNPAIPADVARQITAAMPPNLARTILTLNDPPTPVSAELLRTLSRHDDVGVRVMVSRRENSPPEVFTRLAGDNSSSVREALTGNARVPHPVVLRLAADPDIRVPLALAGRRFLASDVIHVLAAHPNCTVRAAAAAHLCAPVDVLVRLEADSDQGVRAAADAARTHLLHDYILTLPRPHSDRARAVVEAGFPGWPHQLRAVLGGDPQRPTHQQPITR